MLQGWPFGQKSSTMGYGCTSRIRGSICLKENSVVTNGNYSHKQNNRKSCVTKGTIRATAAPPKMAGGIGRATTWMRRRKGGETTDGPHVDYSPNGENEGVERATPRRNI